MALTVSIDTGIGMTFESGHAVIKDFHMERRFDASGNKVFTISYKGRVFMNEAMYDAGKAAVAGFNYEFNLVVGDDADQHNLLKLCYLNLKTQEGFTEGVDA